MGDGGDGCWGGWWVDGVVVLGVWEKRMMKKSKDGGDERGGSVFLLFLFSRGVQPVSIDRGRRRGLIATTTTDGVMAIGTQL